MFTIQLHKLILFAYHGVHEEEVIVGTNFEVSVNVFFEENGDILLLEDTINYVQIYEIVKKQFSIPHKLLETLAQSIVAEIKLVDKRIKTINISIIKLNPPIATFTGNVCVTYSKSFI